MLQHQVTVHKSTIQYGSASEMARDLSAISWRKIFEGVHRNASVHEQECTYCGVTASDAKNLHMHFLRAHSCLEQCVKCLILLDTKTMEIHKNVNCDDNQVILRTAT